MRTRAECKAEAIEKWRTWRKDNGRHDDKEMYLFFLWLKQQPYALDFKYSGDPWQIVHGWLEEYEATFGRNE